MPPQPDAGSSDGERESVWSSARRKQPGPSGEAGGGFDPELERAIVARCTRRLLPFLMVAYVASFLDRANLGNAHQSLLDTLGISEIDYGIAAAVFFITYVLFEVPSNLLMERWSARALLFIIMLLWGSVSALSACAAGPTSLIILRLALGAAESGFFPGVVYYLSFWFSPWERAERLALLYTAIPVAGVLGAALAYGFLQMDGVLGLFGWQWLFLIEGIPTIVLALVAFLYLDDGPWAAPWLTDEEARIVASRPGIVTPPWRMRIKVVPSAGGGEEAAGPGLLASLKSPSVALFAAVYFCDCFPIYALSLYLPAIIAEFGFHPLLGNLLSALPYLAAVVAMLTLARHSDRSGERPWHLAAANAAAALAAFALAATYAAPARPGVLYLQLGLVSLLAAGVLAAMPITMGWAASDAGGSPAVSIALVVIAGNLGGALSAVAMSELRARTGGYGAGLATLGASKVAAAGLAFALRWVLQKRAETEETVRLDWPLSPTSSAAAAPDVTV